MKKFKYVLWALLIGFLGLLVYQNQGMFLSKHSLDINIGFAQYSVPELYSIVIIAIFFFMGMLIAYASSLFERYRAHKQIQTFKQTIDSYSGTISALKEEVEGLKTKPEVDKEVQEMPAVLPTPTEKETT